MSLIRIIGNPSTHPLKFGESFTFSIYATAATTITPSCPDSLVTLSAARTFTDENKFTPQAVTVTIISDDGGVYGTRKIPITLTDGAGGTEVVYAVYTDYTDLSYFKGFNWSVNKHVNSSSDIQGLIDGFVTSAFNGNGKPTNATPSAIVNGFTGGMLGGGSNGMTSSNLSNFSSIDELTFTETDRLGYTWTSKIYHIKASSPVGKVWYQFTGHGEGGHEAMANAMLALGWDVVFCGMPVTGGNTTTNPNITLTGGSGHNQILSSGLDNGTEGEGNHFYLFVSDKIQCHNYLKANYSHTVFATTGISGGGIICLSFSMMINDVSMAFPTRGAAMTSITVGGSADYEGGNSTLISNMLAACSPHDMFLIIASKGLCMLVNNTNDTVFKNTDQYIVKEVNDDAVSLGGRFKAATDTDVTYATHAYSVNDIAAIVAEL